MRATVRTLLAVAGAAVFLVAGIAIGRSQTEPGDARVRYGPLDLQAFAVARDETTSSQEFSGIPGMEGVPVCLAYLGLSATANLDLTGGRVEVRIVEETPDGPRQLPPGPVVFDPDAGENTFTYQALRFLKSPAATTFSVQWRSIDGDVATLRKGSVLLQYGGRQGEKRGCA